MEFVLLPLPAITNRLQYDKLQKHSSCERQPPRPAFISQEITAVSCGSCVLEARASNLIHSISIARSQHPSVMCPPRRTYSLVAAAANMRVLLCLRVLFIHSNLSAFSAASRQGQRKMSKYRQRQSLIEHLYAEKSHSIHSHTHKFHWFHAWNTKRNLNSLLNKIKKSRHY